LKTGPDRLRRDGTGADHQPHQHRPEPSSHGFHGWSSLKVCWSWQRTTQQRN